MAMPIELAHYTKQLDYYFFRCCSDV